MANHNRDQNPPNRAANMEQAEGSRETAMSNTSEDTKAPEGPDSENSGGITNRDLDREREEQQRLPDRGHSRSEHDRSRTE